MQVKELIKQLEDLNAPNKAVYFDDEEWGERPVSEVTVAPYGDGAVILISHK